MHRSKTSLPTVTGAAGQDMVTPQGKIGRSSKLLGLLEESAKLRRDLQDVQGHFLNLLGRTSTTTMTTESPILRPLSNGSTPTRPQKERERKRKRRREGKENVCESKSSSVVGDRSLKDISQISGITSSSFREQPSTANLSGNFHSTFNYPLHSTLSYPLSSTFRMDGLEMSTCSSVQDRTMTPPAPRSRSNTSRRVRSMVNQAVRDHLIPPDDDTEIDCDCDSSVLTDLSDDDHQGHIPGQGHIPPVRRVLKRQTGQAVLTTCSLRAPVALSRSDFLVLDETLEPHFDATMLNNNDSLNATRGSLPDLDSVAMETPIRKIRKSRPTNENIPPQPQRRKSHRDSEPDSGVSCSSRRNYGQSRIQVLDRPSRYQITDDVDKKTISRRLKRFNTPKHSMKIKTLGVF